MQLARPASSPVGQGHRHVRMSGRDLRRDPRRFGRRTALEVVAAPKGSSLADDLRLFAVTFSAGFLFVSILIG